MMKRATVVAADKWLDQLVHQSPAFQAVGFQKDGTLVVQDLSPLTCPLT